MIHLLIELTLILGVLSITKTIYKEWKSQQ
jgi:hypothetical protein